MLHQYIESTYYILVFTRLLACCCNHISSGCSIYLTIPDMSVLNLLDIPYLGGHILPVS